MGRIGVWEGVIILIMLLVVFGGRKLPDLGRSLGRGLANFRQAVREPDPVKPSETPPPPGDDPDQPRPS
ncbi:MAG: twin-arginine translocase TatA/TatE family subunit [Candidatus Adiutrix sp.]|jgi:sec-independent protein translocase protein TatA|nr:twin-arginine translocase TatA/TatE family subunit [Candidatus Adiutrix sp.]